VNDEVGPIRELLDQASEARGRRRLDEAHRHVSSAVELAREGDDSEVLAQAINDQARIERDLGQLDAAVAGYEELARLRERESDVLGVAHAVRHLGDLLRVQGQLPQADAAFRRAIGLLRVHSGRDRLSLANALRGHALLLGQTGQAAEARTMWEEALGLYQVNGIRDGVAECESWLARLASP